MLIEASLPVFAGGGHSQYDRVRMGGVTSRFRRRCGELRGWTWSGPAGDHSPYPQDLVPYPGDELLYCYLDIITKYKIMRNTVNLGPSVVTTNVDEYLEDLNQCCEAGFVLNHFTKVPGIKSTTEVQNWADPHPYQAILSRPAHRPQTEKWRLKIEKRILSTRLLATAEYEEEKDLINTIHENAKKGGRLLCAETIGYVRSGTSNDQYVVMGVDLFFNLPLHPNPTRFVYHTIRVPVRYHVVPDSTQTVQQIECDADWMGQLKLFLDKGWKLVDICIDTTALADAFGMKDSSRQIDTIWIFEKPYNKLHDSEPLYEGVIIEYFHKTKRLLGEERPAKDWRPVIAGMGVTGWELATIIQTPYLTQSTFTTYTLKLLMIFQRPIDREHHVKTKAALLEQALQAKEREQLKFGAFGITKSSSVPGMANYGLATGITKMPSSSSGGKDKKLLAASPRLPNKRYVYGDADALAVPNGVPTGAGAESFRATGGGLGRGSSAHHLHPDAALAGGAPREPLRSMWPSHSYSMPGLHKNSLDIT